MRIKPNILNFRGKLLLFLIIGFSLLALSLFILKIGWVPAAILSIMPLTIYLLVLLLERPILAFFGVFIINYFIMGAIRYLPGLPAGIIIDGMLLITFAFTLFRSREGVIDWGGSRNILTLLSGIWLIYCILLVFNPATTLPDWSAGVRGLALYIFIFPLLTALLFNQYKDLKTFLFVWSLLTLLAVLKALMQKYIGFDSAEKSWLFVGRGSTTHIIFSGVRYFSFFSDAAGFGCGMGLSMVVFSIVAFSIRSKLLRVYYIVIAILACYGMMISGTRAAIVIPFVGYAFFLLLSKQWKIILPGVILIVLAFVLFKYTYIGHGNTEIRRMRSAFNVTQDASFKVRQANQAEMRIFMKRHPLGIGIGKAKRTEPGDYMYELPTDSSLVYVWVETGIVGLALFLLIFIATFVRGVYDAWYKIRDRQLRFILCALLAGLAGMVVCSYGNEVLQQFPNGPILYICMAFIFMGQKFDKEITDGKAT